MQNIKENKIHKGDTMQLAEQINEVLDTLRPFLRNDGGDIEFVEYKDGIVYVRFLGACATCHLMDVTLKEGVELALTTEIPEVIEVIAVP